MSNGGWLSLSVWVMIASVATRTDSRTTSNDRVCILHWLAHGNYKWLHEVRQFYSVLKVVIPFLFVLEYLYFVSLYICLSSFISLLSSSTTLHSSVLRHSIMFRSHPPHISSSFPGLRGWRSNNMKIVMRLLKALIIAEVIGGQELRGIREHQRPFKLQQ